MRGMSLGPKAKVCIPQWYSTELRHIYSSSWCTGSSLAHVGAHWSEVLGVNCHTPKNKCNKRIHLWYWNWQGAASWRPTHRSNWDGISQKRKMATMSNLQHTVITRSECKETQFNVSLTFLAGGESLKQSRRFICPMAVWPLYPTASQLNWKCCSMQAH